MGVTHAFVLSSEHLRTSSSVFWRLKKHLVALDVSNLHVFLRSQRQTVITGGSSCCILSHFALRAWMCSRTHVNTKPFETRQDRYAPWTLWARSTVCSWRNLSHICILILINNLCKPAKLLCSAHNGHVSERHHGREPVLPEPRDWKEHLDWTWCRAHRKQIQTALALPGRGTDSPATLCSLSGLNVLVSWVWLGSGCLMLLCVEKQQSQTYRGTFAASLALRSRMTFRTSVDAVNWSGHGLTTILNIELVWNAIYPGINL